MVKGTDDNVDTISLPWKMYKVTIHKRALNALSIVVFLEVLGADSLDWVIVCI